MTVIKPIFISILGLLLIAGCMEPQFEDNWSLDEITIVNTIGYCRGIHIVDGVAYVAAGAAGVQGWDVSQLPGGDVPQVLNIDHTTVIYSGTFPGSFIYDRDIAQVYYSKHNTDLFILENQSPVIILNIENPDSIRSNTSVLSNETYSFKAVFDELDTIRLYAADFNDGLKWHTYVVDPVYGLWTQINGDEIKTQGNPVGIDVSENFVVVGQGQQGIELFTYTGGDENPVSIGKFDTEGLATTPTISGNDLFVACDFGGAVYFDLTELPVDTTTNIIRGYGYYFAEDLNVDHIALQGNIAVLTLGPSGIALYDVTNPKKPIAKGIFDIGYTYETIFDSGMLYAATREGMQIYEIQK